MDDRGNMRVDLVDGLRGFALLGLLLVHMMERFELYWLDPRPDSVFDAVFFVFAGKSFALFAFCFGFSMATILDNAERRGTNGTARFAWRMLLLLAIGTLHSLWYRGDILQVLAVMGLAMLPVAFVRRPALLVALGLLAIANPLLIVRALAAGAGEGWAQAAPAFTGDTGLSVLAEGTLGQMIAVNAGPGFVGKWSFYLDTGRLLQIAGLILLGIAAARIGLLARPERFPRMRAAILIVSLCIGAGLYLFTERLLPPESGPPMQRDHWQWALGSWQATAWMAAQAMLFIILWHGAFGRFLRPLADAGRMTLTLYCAQSLIFVPVFYGFGLGLFAAGSHALWLLVGIAAFAVQLVFARWWLARFRYGPLEWLWRRATLLAPVPLRAMPAAGARAR